MRIRMYKSSAKYLLREDVKQFPVDVGQIETIVFQLLQIANFVAVNPFGSQNALFKSEEILN